MVRQNRSAYIRPLQLPGTARGQAAARLADSAPPGQPAQIPLFQRDVEPDTLPACREHGMGVVAFFALAGLLSDRYLAGIPAGFRAASASPSSRRTRSPEEKLATVRDPACTGLQRVSPCRNSHCNGCCATPW